MTESHTKPDELAPAPPPVSPSATGDAAWQAVAMATQGAYEVLAELARDAEGAVAFVGRPVAGGDLVILKLEPEDGSEGTPTYTLFELKRLDETVPAPRISCPMCAAQVAAWQGRCAVCSSVIGAGTETPVGTDILLAFYQFVSATYDVVGELATEGSGPPAYLVRTRADHHHVVLRLALGESVAGSSPSYLVDVLPLATASRASGTPTRVPLDVAAPPAVPTRSTQAAATNERVCPQCGAQFGAGTLFCPRDGASLRLVTTGTDLIGQLIDDRYYIEQRLGEGGMGEVYVAHQVRTGRKCALKLMHRSMTQDPDAVGRFRREAASACAISHPNVATVFDSGETLDQRPYFAMEFVDGRPLSHVIRDEAPLDPWRAADIARQIADGLSAAHDFEIIHRDLKPDNVMLGTTRSGGDFVKLVDFGIAKPTKGAGNTLTRTGFILGTPAYMSPEQLCADKLDGRSDLYSLGCVLHEMLTGATPFAGQSLEMLMMRRLTEPAPHPRTLNEDIPEVLDEIVARLLGRNADDRYADARSAADVLGAAQDAIGGKRATANVRTPGVAAAMRTPMPGPREPSVVRAPTTGQQPRRSKDAVPPAPLSPAIPFRAPSLSMPAAEAGAAPVPTPGPAAARRRSYQRVAAVTGAVLVVAGGAFAAWRLTSKPTGPSGITTPAATSSAASPPSSSTPVPPVSKADSQVKNRAVASDKPLLSPPPRPAEQHAEQPAPTHSGSAVATGQSSAVVQSAVPAPASGGVTVAPPLTSTPRDTKPAQPVPQPPVVETKPPRVDAAAEAERIESGRVRESVESYVHAIGGRRMDILHQLFPSMNEEYRRGYEALFAAASDLSTQLTGTPTISVHGTTADAQFAYDLAGQDPSRGSFNRHFSLRAKLQRTDQGWIFVSLDAAP